MYWVTMTDQDLSGWGKAEGKISKYVLECSSHQEALIVAENAKNHPAMIHVKICNSKPSYNSDRYQAIYQDRVISMVWYQPNAW